MAFHRGEDGIGPIRRLVRGCRQQKGGLEGVSLERFGKARAQAVQRVALTEAAIGDRQAHHHDPLALAKSGVRRRAALERILERGDQARPVLLAPQDVDAQVVRRGDLEIVEQGEGGGFAPPARERIGAQNVAPVAQLRRQAGIALAVLERGQGSGGLAGVEP